jgi:hypothetical protein
VKGTWQTTDGGGSGAGSAVAVVVVALVAVAVLGPVVRAAVSLLETVLIVAGVLTGILALAAIAFAVWRLRHRSVSPGAAPWAVSRSPARELPRTQHRAIEPPREVHLHFHNVSPEDIAAITARHSREDIPGDIP